jgi:hypothetical protein
MKKEAALSLSLSLSLFRSMRVLVVAVVNRIQKQVQCLQQWLAATNLYKEEWLLEEGGRVREKWVLG